jgi:hypothetical protein
MLSRIPDHEAKPPLAIDRGAAGELECKKELDRAIGLVILYADVGI